MQFITALECLNKLADAFVTTSFHIPSRLKRPASTGRQRRFYLPKRVSHAQALETCRNLPAAEKQVIRTQPLRIGSEKNRRYSRCRC